MHLLVSGVYAFDWNSFLHNIVHCNSHHVQACHCALSFFPYAFYCWRWHGRKSAQIRLYRPQNTDHTLSVSQSILYGLQLLTCSGGSKRGPRVLSVQFLSFLRIFRQNLCQIISRSPPSGKSWIRHWHYSLLSFVLYEKFKCLISILRLFETVRKKTQKPPCWRSAGSDVKKEGRS